MGKLEKLTKLNLSRNKLTELPSEFFRLAELRYLNLSNNNFASVSPDISDLHMLDVLVSLARTIDFFPLFPITTNGKRETFESGFVFVVL